MIEIYEGRIGGGKSYLAVSTIMRRLLSGGVVLTNIELDIDRVREWLACRGWELGEDQYHFFEHSQAMDMFGVGAQIIGSVLVVLDEAHLWLSARDWSQNSKKYPDLLSLLTQSRKVEMDAIFITQHASNIDGVIRRLAMFTWRCRDVSAWSRAIIGFGMPSCWRFYRARIDYDGKTILNWQMCAFDKQIADCYNSHALLKPLALASSRSLASVGRKVKPTWSQWLKSH